MNINTKKLLCSKSDKKSSGPGKVLTLAVAVALSGCGKTSDISPNNSTTNTIDRVAKEKNLNTQLSLQPNSEIPSGYIRLGYTNDKKTKFDDVLFQNNQQVINYESKLNTLGANIINDIKIVDGLQKLDGTNRNIKILNSDLLFTDEEINTIATQPTPGLILDHPKIKSYILQENIKRIDQGLAPIISWNINICKEIGKSGIYSSTHGDGIGFTTALGSVGTGAPTLDIHEMHRHMISGNHQELYLKYNNPSNSQDYYNYFEGMIERTNPITTYTNSVASLTGYSSGHTSMLENGTSRVVRKDPRALSSYKIDTTLLKKQDGSIGVVQTTDPLYDGNANRVKRKNKYNDMTAKYISAYIDWKKTQPIGSARVSTSSNINITPEILNILKSSNKIISEHN